ncbi:MAG: DNA-processing protein DprA [bacterium]
MELFLVTKNDPLYPPELTNFLHENSPESLTSIGNLHILKHKKLALFCSVKCPGHLILKTHDFVHRLLELDIAVISGFHSPVEKECLRILLQGKAPIIICPARSISNLRIPVSWKRLLNEERLLLLSPFGEGFRRTNKNLASTRNRFVAALADEIIVSHAATGGKTIEFVHEVVNWGKSMLTFECAENARLLKEGAKPLD